VEKLQKSLNNEIIRRCESSVAIESLCVSIVSSMEKRLNNAIDQRIGHMVSQFEIIEEKLNTLNARLDEEKGNIPNDIEQRGRNLKDMIVKFQDDFVSERQNRLNREGKMMRLISDHANQLRKYWNDERKKREKNFAYLTDKLNESEQSHNSRDKELKEMVNEKLKKIKDDFLKEQLERKLEDNEIVDALNRYNDKIQNGLSTLGSSCHSEENQCPPILK